MQSINLFHATSMAIKFDTVWQQKILKTEATIISTPIFALNEIQLLRRSSYNRISWIRNSAVCTYTYDQHAQPSRFRCLTFHLQGRYVAPMMLEPRQGQAHQFNALVWILTGANQFTTFVVTPHIIFANSRSVTIQFLQILNYSWCYRFAYLDTKNYL